MPSALNISYYRAGFQQELADLLIARVERPLQRRNDQGYDWQNVVAADMQQVLASLQCAGQSFQDWPQLGPWAVLNLVTAPTLTARKRNGSCVSLIPSKKRGRK